MYYNNKESTKSQCFPSVVNNRFYQALPSLQQGSSSTVIYNPSNSGVSDIVLTLVLPAPQGGDGQPGSWLGWAMPKNWGAAMIESINLRIAGSDQFAFLGEQIAVDTWTDCENGSKADAVFALGGSELLTQSDYADASNRTASIYVKIPQNSISALQKSNPIPFDLLTLPMQLIIQFKRFADVAYKYNTSLSNNNLPVAFADAYVNFRETTLVRSKDLLNDRFNMNDHALTQTLRYFSQTQYNTTAPFTKSGGKAQQQQLSLTGFRAGSLRYMSVMVRRQGAQPWDWTPLSACQVLINGLVYYDSRGSNNQMWSLCERKAPTVINNTRLTGAGAGVGAAVPEASTTPWLVVPFSQLSEPGAYESHLMFGIALMNSVVNLNITLPDSAPEGVYQVMVSYAYACQSMITRGNYSYVFA
jgi:hypothetical protein